MSKKNDFKGQQKREMELTIKATYSAFLMSIITCIIVILIENA